MKRILRKIAPAVLLAAYSIIAGGSLEDIGITLAIVGVLLVIGVIWALISDSNAKKKKREQGLAKATDNFGSYTHQVEYSLGKYILYDEPTHRILLNDSISDSRKLRELKTTKRAPRTKVTYKEETVTKTSTGSAIGRGVAGAVLLGPVGAIVGGATAKKKTETKKTPEYNTIPGHYTIEVIDIEGNTRAKYSTSEVSKHEEVYRFLQNIIDKNLEPERIAHEIEAAENCNAIQAINASSVVVGSNVELIQGLLINSTKTADDDGENYILCPEVVTVINKGWGASFDEVRVKVKNNLLSKLIGLSKNYTAGTFKNLILDAHMLSQQITSQYGDPSNQHGEISYTEFTDDNNSAIAYDWSETCNQTLKIDYVYDKGKFKYKFTSEI